MTVFAILLRCVERWSPNPAYLPLSEALQALENVWPTGSSLHKFSFEQQILHPLKHPATVQEGKEEKEHIGIKQLLRRL